MFLYYWQVQNVPANQHQQMHAVGFYKGDELKIKVVWMWTLIKLLLFIYATLYSKSNLYNKKEYLIRHLPRFKIETLPEVGGFYTLTQNDKNIQMTK